MQSGRDQIDESERSPLQEYYDSTPVSRELYQEAVEHMPGGNTRGVLYYSPYPAYIESGDGCYVTDVDGNEYLDFLNNYTTLVHGHTPESVYERAIESIHASAAPGGPTRVEIDWAEHLCERADAVEHIRFTNSGTEATMNAIRAARAYTGKDVIAKFEGCYHGTHDDVQVSVHPPTHLAGPSEDPKSVPDSAGVPASKQNEVISLPFNDTDAVTEKLERHRDELAGVIIAPFMGSAVVPGDDSFIDALDSFTTEHDIPLIFDEVISFRAAYEGAHTLYDVTPDLVTFGKIIGGGFAVGAFGGREELMAGYDPRGGSDITHSGTFNANPVTAAAGLEALERFTPGEVGRINGLAEQLADEARSVRDDHGIAMQINQRSSLFNIYFTGDPVRDYRDTLQSSTELEHQLHFALLAEGVRLAPKLMGAISTPMGETQIDEFATALDRALERLRPEFEARASHLYD